MLAVDGFQAARQGAFPFGPQQRVIVVRHEAVTQDGELSLGGGLVEQSEERVAVVVGEVGALAVVAALGDLEVGPGRDEAGSAGHLRRQWRQIAEVLTEKLEISAD